MALIEWLRAAEFHLHPSVARLFLKTDTRRFDPYRPEEDALRAIFVHVPRTGGRSVHAALYGTKSRHLCLSRFRAFDADRYTQYFKFTFVRNPWDRAHSAYVNMLRAVGRTRGEDGRWATRHLQGLDTFERFVRALDDRATRRTFMRWSHFRPQVHWLRIPGEPGIGCDFVGRFEHLERDFAHVCRQLGVERQLPPPAPSRDDPYQEAYTAALADRVGELYADDVRTFGYTFT